MDNTRYDTLVQDNHEDCQLLTDLVNSNTVTIIHFNDVYNIESRTQEPVGGAARFVTAVSQLASSNPLVLFSGDAFNPSISMLLWSL